MASDWWVLPSLVGALLLVAILLIAARRPSPQAKFGALGTLTGRSAAEIIAAVGPPNTVSALPGGGQLLQWQSVGYHVALAFDAQGICMGVTFEHSAVG